MQCPLMHTTLLLTCEADNMDQATLIVTTNLNRLMREGYLIQATTVYPVNNDRYRVSIKATNRKV